MELLEIKNNKKCTKCKIPKERTKEFFPTHNKVKDGLDSWCRKCRSTYRNEINRGVFRDSISDENLKRLKKQITSCQICGKKEDLVVDHNHKTNVVRGILCNHCNRGIGHFLDNESFLELAIKYLIRTKNFGINYWKEYFNKH
jgi:nitrate/TMAO reductase-like tetraheme cytochrome c subunit